jgi:L-threonylcarbamoyladenylate synthase
MDPVVAAVALFDVLHELDAGGFDELWAERLPDQGLGLAVNDRLYKASVK